jgi:hypothetical protein
METGMAINTQKVVVGGLVAGVVLNIIDFLTYGMILADRLKADLNAFMPGFGDANAAMETSVMIKYIVFDFVVGILLVWTYAAMRPRFGPGPQTATYVGLAYWVFGLIITSGFLQWGMMSTGLWWTIAIIWLVCLVLGSIAGAMVYKEDAAA